MSRFWSNPEEASTQNIHSSRWYEIGYWAGRFGVSQDELRTAVHAVGNDPEAVREHLSVRPPDRVNVDRERD